MEYKRFNEFADEPVVLDGSKLDIATIINKEILIIGYRIANSKYPSTNNSKCLTLHLELEGTRYIVFTGSLILLEQVEKYKDQIPFLTIIKKVDKYLTFS